MPDLQICNVAHGDIKTIDALAARMGISRTELLRREVHKLARRGTEPMSRSDLDSSVALFVDVLDENLMEKAWR